eukprot:5230967-Pleurochrysis_carterae.AAC.2
MRVDCAAMRRIDGPIKNAEVLSANTEQENGDMAPFAFMPQLRFGVHTCHAWTVDELQRAIR